MSSFPDPNQLSEISPAAILDALARGHLALDKRAVRALVAKSAETIAAVTAFSKGERGDDILDLYPELVALVRHFHAPEGLPLLMWLVEEEAPDIPDELTETIVSFGKDAVEPLLDVHAKKEEDETGDILFMLANLGVRDDRIFALLSDHLQYDARDAAFLLGLYGDPAAAPLLEGVLADLKPGESDVRNEIEEALDLIKNGRPAQTEADRFDIFELYPEEDILPVELLTESERIELLDHPVASLRAAAAHSFFNRELEHEVQAKLLKLAQSDPDVQVRARAWETLMDATENPEFVESMLKVMRDPEAQIEERGAVLVGLSPEADRNEVREAMIALYEIPEGRAKALEAMWRSVHPAFREYFPRHMSDPDLETRRNAIWGVGYHAIRSELDKLRGFFDDDELRGDALFAYAMTIPGDISPARMKSMLARVEKDAKGLSEEEELLVMTALDERLLLAGKKPYFAGRND